MSVHLSYEIFPPKFGLPGSLVEMVRSLNRLGGHVSVTYGAAGASKARSEEAIDILIDAGLAGEIAPHLTAAGQDKGHILDLARSWYDRGIRRVVVLRGDAPAEGVDEFTCAAELAEAINARIPGFDIAVAGYPEYHPKSPSPEAEIAHLKRKVEAGANRVITQFFFDADLFLRYRDVCVAAGIDVPIVPGILPVSSLSTLHRFAAACGASIPVWLDNRFEGIEGDAEAVRALSIATAVSLSERLIAEGVEDIHLYTLNRVSDAQIISRALGSIPPSLINTIVPELKEAS